VKNLADAMLAKLGLDAAELSVLLTDDTTIHQLNLEHRQKDRPTDVLAFPLDAALADAPRVLGDVVISIDTALRQARSRRRELFAEVRFLLAHGLLHLIGYDHDTREHKREMDGMARRLVRAAQQHDASRVAASAKPSTARAKAVRPKRRQPRLVAKPSAAPTKKPARKPARR
jgi:probable rRNA maturation factor